VLIGLILIGSLSSLFNGINFDLQQYVFGLIDNIKNLSNPLSLTYIDVGTTRLLFPEIISPWLHSLITLFLSFIVSSTVALVLTYLTLRLPKKLFNVIEFIISILEAIPDVLVMALFQIGVLFIYQKTHILFLNIEAYKTQPIILPVLVLSILPTIMLYRMMLVDFIDESEKPYVELAKGKGLKPSTIILVHVFRNALIKIFSETKYIFWFMLSNLLIVEYVFNIFGLAIFMLRFPSPSTFTIGLILFFVPIYLFLSIGQIAIEKITKESVDIT
jgi:peptide/nickel transport system permease protein